ncbi:hypothetical protein SDRG_02971 [Saprolegnia diclina VS20]|uniref:RCK N-terminal domain-containing protein n=1 Tax=Saprolegnia diclina (strain VS20) TaxID=1156394 RepID=T0S3D2_SAPDV|nr:hypothetical protein SDRG_02971 [Saprolegnia diclina VS20]EQC39533.1 hypothetical protein SDRG_02971 [Saprolegnia diclina VS20]|eukprot:XP_008606805.1 hypothetical protein SDRG_02971 [Saprolegnia diclina VS20]
MVRRRRGFGLYVVYLRVRSKLIKPRMRGETFRRWVARNMDNSLLSSILDIVQVGMGLIVTLLYTDKNWSMWNTSVDSAELGLAHAFMGVLFAFDYALCLYAADDRVAFFVDPVALADFVTIYPQFIDVVISPATYEASHTYYAALKSLMPFRCLRCFRLLSFARTAKQREMGTLFFGVVAIIICFGAIGQAIEACPCKSNVPDPSRCTVLQKNTTSGRCQDLSIYNAMYFVVITIATLGYGDIAPKSQLGRVSVTLLIIASSVVLPMQISKLSDVVSRETEYDNAFTGRTEKHPHVVLCGDVTASALDFFLREYLNPRNLNWKDKVVILSPSLPSHNLKRVLLDPAYEQRVKYLQGSAMSRTDLLRAKAAAAKACYVMVDKRALDSDTADTAANFITISLRHFNKHVPLFVQVGKTDNIGHISLSGASNILCIDQLVMGILAKSCLIPGLPALLTSILFSITSPTRLEKTGHPRWVTEYLGGASHNIYDVMLPTFLEGNVSFAFFAFLLFQELRIVLVGLYDADDGYRLFPSSERLRTSHTLFVLATTPQCRQHVRGITLAMLQKHKALLPTFDDVSQAWNFLTFTTKLANAKGGLLSARTSITTTTSLQSHRHSSLPIVARSVKNALADGIDHGLSRVDSFVSDAGLLATEPTLPVNEEKPPARIPRLVLPSSVEDGEGPLFAAALLRDRSYPAAAIDAYGAFLATAVPETMRGHVVLCGLPTSLQDFILPLRNASHGAVLPIVVVSSAPLTEAMFARLGRRDQVYYICGSPLSAKTLAAACVTTSKSIVILASCAQTPPHVDDDDVFESELDSNDVIDHNMPDTDAITLHRFVTEVCETSLDVDAPRPSIVIELSRPSSVRFLKTLHDEDMGTTNGTQRSNEVLDSICHPLFAGGHIVVSNALDALLGSCKKTGSGIDFLHLLVFGEADDTERPRALRQVPVPAALLGQSYAACFEALLLHEDTLCLGVFRARTSVAHFTFVNPAPDTLLAPHDRLFIVR